MNEKGHSLFILHPDSLWTDSNSIFSGKSMNINVNHNRLWFLYGLALIHFEMLFRFCLLLNTIKKVTFFWYFSDWSKWSFRNIFEMTRMLNAMVLWSVHYAIAAQVWNFKWIKWENERRNMSVTVTFANTNCSYTETQYYLEYRVYSICIIYAIGNNNNNNNKKDEKN